MLGLPLQPKSLTHEFVRISALAPALPRIHPNVAQERLGHSTIGITLDLYSQVMPGKQEDSATKVDGTMRAAIKKLAEPNGSQSVFSRCLRGGIK